MSAGDETTLMPLRLIQWVRDVKGSRIGTVTIVLGKSMKMIDLSVNRSNGTIWVGMPSRPMTKGREVLVDDKGKTRWMNQVQWIDRQSADRFSRSVVEAIRHAGPIHARAGRSGRHLRRARD